MPGLVLLHVAVVLVVRPVANPEEWRMCLTTLFSLALLEKLTRPLQQQTTHGERDGEHTSRRHTSCVLGRSAARTWCPVRPSRLARRAAAARATTTQRHRATAGQPEADASSLTTTEALTTSPDAMAAPNQPPNASAAAQPSRPPSTQSHTARQSHRSRAQPARCGPNGHTRSQSQ